MVSAGKLVAKAFAKTVLTETGEQMAPKEIIEEATKRTISQAEKMATVRATGKAGEAGANIVKNTAIITSLTKTDKYRVPDVLDHASRIIGEVKNVKSLSYNSIVRLS
ncbi:MAG: hypothetical protein JXX29_12830 [Deltaproteobacteria bacterium]|nr:hypothetical protein [Deltaproteobacteria bacterium]MBN2672561.1 hypothetical protein [Deltaproteobacteria bacterium]